MFAEKAERDPEKYPNPLASNIRPYIVDGTKIKMFEYDLHMFSGKESHWEWMAEEWLEAGASLEILVQKIHPDAEDNVKQLQQAYTDNIQIFDFSDYLSQNNIDDAEKSLLTTRHYTLFRAPNGRKSVWLELSHKESELKMDNCQFIGRANGWRAWRPFEKDFDAIKYQSKEIYLAEFKNLMRAMELDQVLPPSEH
jgi:hypothetical protein